MADIIKSVVNASGTIISKVLGGVTILFQNRKIISMETNKIIATSDGKIISLER